jgi:hypothetical protein
MSVAGLADATTEIKTYGQKFAGQEAELDEADEQTIGVGSQARDLDREYARQQRGADQQARQAEQTHRTGTFGFKGFYENRTELTGTPAYDGDWLTHKRPTIERGIGPGAGSGLVDRFAAHRVQKGIANQRAELAPTIEAGEAAEARQADPNRHVARREVITQRAVERTERIYGARNSAGARPPGSQFAAPTGAPPAWPGTATSSKKAPAKTKTAPAKGRASKRSK